MTTPSRTHVAHPTTTTYILPDIMLTPLREQSMKITVKLHTTTTTKTVADTHFRSSGSNRRRRPSDDSDKIAICTATHLQAQPYVRNNARRSMCNNNTTNNTQPTTNTTKKKPKHILRCVLNIFAAERRARIYTWKCLSLSVRLATPHARCIG